MIKTVVLSAALAFSGVAATAGGLSAPASDTTVTPIPPAPVQQGSLGGILPVVGILGLLLLISQNSSGT